jgi:hypothetical protein
MLFVRSGKKITKHDNFSYLLFSLLLLLFSSAIVDVFWKRELLGQSLVMGMTVISMSIGVWSLRSEKVVFNTAIGVIVGLFSITVFFILLENYHLDFIYLGLMLIFFLLTTRLAAQQALFSGEITVNSIIGSICIFLLLGLIWVMLYLLLLIVSPDAFSGLPHASWQENFPDLLYFSFVVLTTLGFGDILAVSPVARFLVYMEAITGMFYMAIVVSSLVGAGTTKNRDNTNVL